VRQFSDSLDGLVRELWMDSVGGETEVALVATGGWGRGEVAPFSDLDFVLLTPNRRQAVDELAERILYPLWDAGLQVGHSVASPRDAARLAKQDLATATAMLDGRWVAGNRALVDELRRLTSAAIAPGGNANDFVARLAAEMERRHKRFGASIYLLEPNLKQGIGALRDLDTVAWVARARFAAYSMDELVAAGQLSPRQVEVVCSARDFMLKLRALLQHVTARRTDQLTFETQERIAGVLFPSVSEPASEVKPAVAPSVEELMRCFYLHARGTVAVAERFLESAKVPKRRKPRIAKVDASFLFFNGQLAVREATVFDERPWEMLRLFRVAAEHQVPIYGHTKELIEDRVAAGRADLGGVEQATRLFLDALVDVRDVGQPALLEQMHQVGLLSALMPEFAPCTCRVQHDLYHVYTVDQHQLYAVAMLKKHLRGEVVDIGAQVPVAAGLVSRHQALALATLLHDVGKPQGKGHSEKGARIAGTIARRFGMPREDVELVEFLVRQHLTMSHLSQRRDLSDPTVVDRFVSTVGTEERLAALFLLTRCDTAMTAPGNLNEWKDQLLGELFGKTLEALRGGGDLGQLPLRDQADKARARVVERVRRRIAGEGDEGDSGTAQDVRQFVDSLDDSFVLQLSSGQLLRHYRLASERDETGAPVAIHVAHFPLKEHSEVAVVADDSPGLLADITGALSASGVDVLEAVVGTGLPALPGNPPVALDLFHVRDANGKAIAKDDPRWTRIEADLRLLLADAQSAKRARELIARRRASGLRARATPGVPTRIALDNHGSADYSIVEVFTQDRPGVLHDITRCMSELGLDIHLAKIGSEGERVTDAFYVADARARALGTSSAKLTAERMAELETRLRSVLEGDSG